jgi:hypothetical protein
MLPFSPGEHVSLRIPVPTDLGRKATVVTSRGEWRSRPLPAAPFLVFVLSPLRTVIDRLFIENEPAVRTGGFTVGGDDMPRAFGTAYPFSGAGG